ncbi:MAG: DUF4390 domain-containing protein [bacterium]
MRLPGRVRALLLAASVVVAPALSAQRVQLDVAVPASVGTGATVSATNLFADNDMRDLVRSGFPAQLHYRLELWRKGSVFGDDREGHQDWDLVIQYDPSAQRYRVLRRQNGKVDDLGSFATLTTAREALERPTKSTLAPEREGSRYYYTLVLEIEALSVSDMDQLERWLRGVRSGTAASALGSGVRTLVLRMLGGEKRHYDGRSVSFIPANLVAP